MKALWLFSCASAVTIVLAGCTSNNDTVVSDEPSIPTPELRLQHSTLGKLISNGETEISLLDWNHLIPATIPQWIQLLDGGTGEVSGLLIPFSMAPRFTSLKSPRIVLTAPDGSRERGRLFLGILEHEGKTEVEFISWNSLRRAFDFGRVEVNNGRRRVSFANEPTCFSCHRTRSPIFPEETWDNTVLNRSVFASFVRAQAAQGKPGFPKLSTELDELLELDRKARIKVPPAIEEFIDNQMQKRESFKKATYKGFPFVDADMKQAFDFNQAIFDAHTLVVATDWLQTLPNQRHAALIVNEGRRYLIKRYPDHYRSLATFKSPYLQNFNLMAGKVNKFHSLPDVIPSEKNIDAVKKYNLLVEAEGKLILPDKYRPTSAFAFEHHHVDWQDYLTKEILNRSFRSDEPKYQPTTPLGSHGSDVVIAHDKLCSSCHDGSDSSPYPDFSSFNPLTEAGWIEYLEKEPEEGAYLLCTALSRISSSEALMPPRNSSQAKSFRTYRASSILTLKTLIERNQLNCEALK